MTSQTSPALAVALQYYAAWTTGRMDEAMAFVADDIVCDAPAGRIAGATAYRAFLEPFTRILRSARMLAAFGDDTTALVMCTSAPKTSRCDHSGVRQALPSAPYAQSQRHRSHPLRSLEPWGSRPPERLLWEHNAHLYWRRAKVDRLLLGDDVSACDTVAWLSLVTP